MNMLEKMDERMSGAPRLAAVLAMMLLLLPLPALMAQSGGIEVNLWPDGLPNTNGRDLTQPYSDSTHNYRPRFRLFLPDKAKATGQAVLCIPGGGYHDVCSDIEGYNWVPYFLDHGIAIAVLTYRLPYQYPAVPGSDAMEAMRILRHNAAKWGFSPGKIGVMGHSAGGHLAATVATHAVGDARPDFQMLFYPVITMEKSYTQPDTHDNLIGPVPNEEVMHYYSLEQQVRPGQAPAIIFIADDDAVVNTANGVNYYLALNRAHVSASLHIWPEGNHGFSCRDYFKSHDVEMQELFSWLKSINK